ncbi:DNA repair protein [Lineolata rhizophorae]|uniref:DNA repair protein n=1 Tax=Lineolata rhizophorae TaxID=578093 RepID=A0A6A6P7E8_9PEZI|nr:DNA repair protein [Lineolata rhizophorae]
MAPARVSKRARVTTDEELYGVPEDYDNESVADDSRRDSRKRARLSRATTADGDAETVVDDTNDDVSVSESTEDDDTSTVTGPPVTNGAAPNVVAVQDPVPSTQALIRDYETLRDANFEDLQYEQEDRERVQRFLEMKLRRERDRQNTPAEAGIIEEVRCYNFMCHAKLQVKLGPLINFIIGHNGSGKSAVLTALTLCLGGKATSTNRGQSLKSFIKEGQDSATLSVQIKNEGSAAYKPDEYGRAVIVERHFTTSGASSFKVKNAAGKIVSNKKQELDDILDHFVLQLENPMNVLTQDMARQFLHSSSAAEKYKFFIKGTNLQQLDNDYRLIVERLETLEMKTDRQREDIKVHEQNAREAQRKLDIALRHEGLRAKINEVCNRMAWKQVSEQAARLAQLENETTGYETNVERLRDTVDAKTTQLESNETNSDQANQIVEQLREQLAQPSAALRRAQDDLNDNHVQRRELLQNERQLRDEINASTREIQGYEWEFEAERNRQESANGPENARMMAVIQEAKERRDALDAQKKDIERSFARLDRAVNEADLALRQSKPQVREQRDKVHAKKTQIRNLGQGRDNWHSAYFANMQNLLAAIEREAQHFYKKPVGPIGRHVTLLKPRWSSVLEKSFGAALNAFLVTSKEDQTKLSELMRRTNCEAPIFISDPRPIDTSANEPAADLLTWDRALRIDNPLVRKQLVIANGIEQTVLIENRSDAMDFMTRGQRPVNVRQCYCFQDGSSSEGIRIGFTSSGQETTSPIEAWRKNPRMQTNIQDRIKAEEEVLAQLMHEMVELETREQELGEARKQAVQQREGQIHRFKKVEVDHQCAAEEADRLVDELDASAPRAGMLETLQDQINTAKDSKRIAENQFQEMIQAKDELREAKRQLEEQVEAARVEVEEAQQRLAKAEQRLERLERKRVDAVCEKNKAIDDLRAAETELAEHQGICEQQAEVVRDFEQKASNICPRVPIAEDCPSAEELHQMYITMEGELRNSHANLGGTREELAACALEMKGVFDKAKRDLESTVSQAQRYKMSLQDRQDRWRKFRRFISNRAKVLFQYLLSERTFRGELEILHSLKELRLKIEPDITRESDRGREAKTLSGGEKSFSTICLLLALWEAMGSPIRCLDEFDVFMDSVNRDVSMKMIIQASRRSVSRQYIFITPQSMSNQSFGNDVKIIKMSDPERGQTTLPFGS